MVSTERSQPEAPDRNLALELVRATEAAALAAGRWMGRNEKEPGDQAAVDAMRTMLSTVQMDGLVVIGEGEKDEAPMLFNGEEVGTGAAPEADIAVDPIDGTRLLAEGRPGALSMIAVAPRGTMLDPGPMMYMEKWVVGADAAGVVDLDAPVADNLARIAAAKGKDVNDLTVIALDRSRHEQLFADIRAAGARLRLIMDGDVAGGVLAMMPDRPVDVLIGIGGTPEGVITACAAKALGGEMIGRMWARYQEQRDQALELGFSPDALLDTDRLVGSERTFFVCTGITGGDLVEAVEYLPGGATTDSLVMRGKSGTVRTVRARHTFDKLSQYSAVPFG
ncbi:MAG: fructose-bisphosphatase class II [Actinobacteria bacterium QS_5_72_10]|nr:MAG: fructose-bisphosphatase class II [Actinobacteria bacterium QS_5_72_10]